MDGAASLACSVSGSAASGSHPWSAPCWLGHEMQQRGRQFPGPIASLVVVTPFGRTEATYIGWAVKASRNRIVRCMELSDLYSEKILEIAGNPPLAARLADPDASARKVSRICGSVIDVDLKV